MPVTRPWHEAADWETHASRSGLSARERALVDAFRRDGFVVVEDERILDGIDTESIWSRHAHAFTPENGGRVQDAWRTDPAVRAIACHPAVLDVLRLLYAREPVPFQTLNFLNGTEQLTHSDTIHFNSLPSGFMCGVWMALEDVTLRQGPLHYFPGSQRLPELDYEDLGVPAVTGSPDWTNPYTRASYAEYEVRIARVASAAGFAREELAIRRGTFLVWAANLLHGGSPRDDRSLTRKSQVSHYYFEGSVPYTPMFSQRSAARYAVRRVRDIRTGRWMVPSLDGTTVVFPGDDAYQRGIATVGGPAAALVRMALRTHERLPGSPAEAVRLLGATLRQRVRR